MGAVPFAYCIHTCQERINNPRKFISLNRRARKDFSANKMEATSNSLRSRFRSTEQRYSRLAGFRETPTDYCVTRSDGGNIIIPCIMCTRGTKTPVLIMAGEFFNGTIKVCARAQSRASSVPRLRVLFSPRLARRGSIHASINYCESSGRQLRIFRQVGDF